ncbi:MAG: hypothetical protein APF84_18115 [Gracilibacter sp. BRH_c7a]|nr:MAG: hypothetical protein APF84_18115 [Gracilibacter sp. BRH_c7a]
MLKSFQTELKLVETQMNKDISFKSVTLEELIDLPKTSLDNKLCPALFFAVTTLKSQKSNNNLINFATIFQYIFIANQIHRLVKDEPMTEHERQYPVLVGDFMLGQAFSKLCEGDLFNYSNDFIRIIEEMNEGVLMRWRLKNKNISSKDYREILGKERGSLTALVGRLGAKVSGIEGPNAKKLEDFGYLIGMAWAAWEEPLGMPIVREYLSKAKVIINELRDQYSTKPLQEVFEFFNDKIRINSELASS